jgi:hypothetical protein
MPAAGTLDPEAHRWRAEPGPAVTSPIRSLADAARIIRNTLLGWRVFHFHDTSARANVKLLGEATDN